VLARLSYSTYLVFAIVAAQFISSMQDPLYLTYNEMFWQMIYEILVSFMVAVLIYMFIERPAANLIFGIKRDGSSAKRGTTMVLPSELNQMSQ